MPLPGAGFTTGTDASSVSGPVSLLSAVATLRNWSNSAAVIRAVEVAARVDLGLGHRVRRGVAPGLADLEQVVLVADQSTALRTMSRDRRTDRSRSPRSASRCRCSRP